MDNVMRLDELRKIAVHGGFTRDRDFYIAVRGRNDGRRYIIGNQDHALLFEPDWITALVGNKAEEVMLEMAQLRFQKGDVVGWLYSIVKKGQKDENSTSAPTTVE